MTEFSKREYETKICAKLRSRKGAGSMCRPCGTWKV